MRDRARVVREVLRRHGVIGVAKRALARLRDALRLHAWLDARHAWYLLDLRRDRPRPTVPAGVRVIEGGEKDLPRLADIPATGYLMGQGWLRRGVRLFLAEADGRAAFAGWAFRREVSVSVAPGGWVPLPPDSVALDDCYTATTLRGQGIAPASLSVMADRLAEEGVHRMLAVADEDNDAARHALEKAGFHEVATMITRRRLGRATMRVEPRDDRVGPELQALWT